MFKKISYYWLPVIAYMVLIFYMSSRALPHAVLAANINSRILHGIEFFILAFLLLRAFNTTWMYKYSYHLAVLITAIYGFTDEIHQAFVPGRDDNVGDAIADCIGGLMIFIHKIFKGVVDFSFTKVRI